MILNSRIKKTYGTPHKLGIVYIFFTVSILPISYDVAVVEINRISSQLASLVLKQQYTKVIWIKFSIKYKASSR